VRSLGRERSPRLLWLLGIVALAVQPASAALKGYAIRRTSLAQHETGDLIPFLGVGDAVLEGESAQGSARLLRLEVATDFTGTICCPAGGYVFQSVNSREGPAPDEVGLGDFASSIAWGTVTGWTTTGSFFCHAVPAFYCNLASGVDLSTVDPTLHSSFYDLGTWTFHGTGFTATPFIYRNFTSGGNEQWILRGRQRDRFLPVLPFAGVAALGGSLWALGTYNLRRSKQVR